MDAVMLVEAVRAERERIKRRLEIVLRERVFWNEDTKKVLLACVEEEGHD